MHIYIYVCVYTYRVSVMDKPRNDSMSLRSAYRRMPLAPRPNLGGLPVNPATEQISQSRPDSGLGLSHFQGESDQVDPSDSGPPRTRLGGRLLSNPTS